MNEIEILESTYLDKASVYRNQKLKNPETKQTEFKKVCLFEDIKCALSKDSAGNLEGKTVADTSYTAKLFCSPLYNGITLGDTLEITSCNITVEYVAGKPFIYTSHIEIPLSKKERA